ncbi:MAG: carbohydrate ABC transporter permease [Acholeplasmatales bacterium]|jgi:multiple sugar transport system permease protein|nr:carbohydrate ABC transporter permease [Acholeplasmatales bacterium]
MTNELNIEKKLKIQKIQKTTQTILVYIFLGVMAIVVLIPFYWMINVSFKSTHELVDDDITITFFPEDFSPNNYVNVFKYSGNTTGNISFMVFFGNTMVVALFSTLIGTVFSIFVGFALARLNFPGRDLIFTLLLATMMIPGEMMVITNYTTVARLGWVSLQGGITGGAYYAMIIPFLVSIFHIYLLRQNFKQIPNELYYAAKVDGSSDFNYLVKVMVPMAKSSIITIVILKLMGTWNAYVWPNLVADAKHKIITSWLRSSFVDQSPGSAGRVLLNYQMAAAIIVTVPLLLLFIFFRKYIMSGVSRSGLKG